MNKNNEQKQINAVDERKTNETSSIDKDINIESRQSRDKRIEEELSKRIKIDLGEFEKRFNKYDKKIPSFNDIVTEDDKESLEKYLNDIIHHSDSEKRKMFQEQVENLISMRLREWTSKFSSSKKDLDFVSEKISELDKNIDKVEADINKLDSNDIRIEEEKNELNEKKNKLGIKLENFSDDYKGSKKSKIINIVLLMSVAFVLIFTTIAFMNSIGARYEYDNNLIQMSHYKSSSSQVATDSNESKSIFTNIKDNISWVWIGYALLFFAMGKIVAITYDYIEENTGEEPKWMYYSVILGTFLVVGALMYFIVEFERYDSVFKDADSYQKGYLEPIRICELSHQREKNFRKKVVSRPNEYSYCYAWFNSEISEGKFRRIIDEKVEQYKKAKKLIRGSAGSNSNLVYAKQRKLLREAISPSSAEMILQYYSKFHNVVLAKEKIHVTMIIIKILFALAELLISSFAWLTFGRYLNTELYRAKLSKKLNIIKDKINKLVETIKENDYEKEILESVKFKLEIIKLKLNEYFGNINNHYYNDDKIKNYIEQNQKALNFLYSAVLADVLRKIMESQMNSREKNKINNENKDE